MPPKAKRAINEFLFGFKFPGPVTRITDQTFPQQVNLKHLRGVALRAAWKIRLDTKTLPLPTATARAGMEP
jgi:folate-binding Fe-S cluster repair protein YgfZ